MKGCTFLKNVTGPGIIVCDMFLILTLHDPPLMCNIVILYSRFLIHTV